MISLQNEITSLKEGSTKEYEVESDESQEEQTEDLSAREDTQIGVLTFGSKLQFEDFEIIIGFEDDIIWLQVSNNICEQKVKPIALGRKNFLFSDSMAGAKANAICYTIVETPKANGLNAFKYLTYLFENLPNLENYRDSEVLESFLPWQKTIQEICAK